MNQTDRKFHEKTQRGEELREFEELTGLMGLGNSHSNPVSKETPKGT